MKSQFDKTYALPPLHRKDRSAEQKLDYAVQVQTKLMSEIPHRPLNIGFFQKAVSEPPAVSGDLPVVGYFCNTIPDEILWALNTLPVRLGCGNTGAVSIGEEALSGDICPLAKASFGMVLQQAGAAGRCDAFVLPAGCDAKRKMGNMLNDYAPVFMFNLPPEQNSNLYTGHVLKELKRLITFLEKTMGTKFSGKKLRKFTDLSRQRTQAVRKLQKLRIQNPEVVSVRDLFIVVQASWSGVRLETWLKQAEILIHEIASAETGISGSKPNLILTGAPVIWPNFKILNIIEEAGAEIAADTLCTGVQSHFDPVVEIEKSKTSLLRSLALKNVFASLCPCFISQDKRLNRIVDLVSNLNADGVINYSLRLCQLFDIENYRLERIMKKNNTPFLNLRTDYSLEDTEQLRVRVEAFLEAVSERRER